MMEEHGSIDIVCSRIPITNKSPSQSKTNIKSYDDAYTLKDETVKRRIIGESDCVESSIQSPQDCMTRPCSEFAVALRSSTPSALICTPESEQEKEQRARKEMISALESRLRIKCQQNSTEDPEQIPKTAIVLEKLLFQQAKNIKAYSDKSTLDSRLRSLMTILVRRRMCTSAQKQRIQVLQRILKDRFLYVKDLIRRVRMEKMNKVAKLKCNGVVCGATFGTNLPPVVRNLFFGTTLVQAFEKYPIDRLTNLNWEILIEQAEVNLREFRSWEGLQD